MEEGNLKQLDPIIDKYEDKLGNLIPVLHEVQKEIGYLPLAAQEYVAEELKLPLSKVYGVATFYTQFSLEPKGEYVINVCDGTACHVRGSQAVLDKIKEKINLEDGKYTTDDMMFTLETVSCLGASGLAPVVTINGKIYSKMSPEEIEVIIDELVGRDDQ
jgi:NADH-quinone oxidoreductase subunit E